MDLTASPRTAADRLLELVGRIESVDGFAEVVAALHAGQAATLDGVWGSSCALAAAALTKHAPQMLLLVTPHPGDIDRTVDDLSLFTREEIERFPAWESLHSEGLLRDEVFGQRLALLKRLAAQQGPKLIVTSIQSLLQPVADQERLALNTRRLRVGQTFDLDEFLRWLVENGFHAMSAVELPGEFSHRGGILDIYPPDEIEPIRVELFGDEIASLRRFEVVTQRSLAQFDEIDLTVLNASPQDRGHLAEYLPPQAWVLYVEPSELEEEGRHFLERLDRPDDFHSVTGVMERLAKFPSATGEALARGSLDVTCHLKIESAERFSGDISKLREELEAAGIDQQVFIVCQTEAEVQRLTEIFGETGLAREGRLQFPVGHLQGGFRLVPARTLLLSAAELFQRTDTARPSRRRWGRVIDSFLELNEGDFVVHVGHGIGRYLGLRLLEKGTQTEEHLELEFQGGTKLFVPTTRIELVQKYVGGSKARPTLARLGGKTWARHKQLAEDAVIDMARDMLDLQASRASRPGIGFPTDTAWQNEFDASFPYTETADQLAAISDLKRDMHLARPMDRLICGDVGYGKTEVAMRAVFKAVDSGYQVAVLVPTTILAEQHRRTFAGRMAEYPFNIASLSRFLTGKEQNQVIAGLAEGSIDIVIGTHRLVQPDIQFHNLGLVVIDEEQRFGVQAKERLKTLRQVVDVLTLTATPIPRTLHMSLLGLRDISNLETPPADRLAVETRVTRFSSDLVRQAILRELNRGGQIFFVHNRIHDLHVIAQRLNHIVPECRIGIGHGQMPEHELEEVMLGFVQHKFDLLLSTTIVESGLDIPNANTIFIDQADRYGLADLHQLRGRVGRYKHRAYCYLLVDPNTSLSPEAAKRLRAIEEYSHIGAGFAIAMRDLEIRGAGNILGTQQSGHIAAVGYELYCQLLEQAVAQLKHEQPRQLIDVHVDLPGEAYIPRTYAADQRRKIDLYRRLCRINTLEDLADFSAELTDRFGPHPEPVDRLLSVIELRVMAAFWSIDSIHLEDDFVAFGYENRARIEALAKMTKRGPLRIADGRSAYLPLAKGLTEPDAIHARIKALLRPGG
jgi:transcription-repair coupling factor (superfamily II helicase)